MASTSRALGKRLEDAKIFQVLEESTDSVHARVKICIYLCIFQVLFVYSIASSDAIVPPPAWHLKG